MTAGAGRAIIQGCLPGSRLRLGVSPRLKRNDDRDWFRGRRDEYDRVVRGPMIAVIEQLAVDFGRFAPELVASARTSLYPRLS